MAKRLATLEISHTNYTSVNRRCEKIKNKKFGLLCESLKGLVDIFLHIKSFQLIFKAEELAKLNF